MSDKYIGGLPEHAAEPADDDQGIMYDVSEALEADRTKRYAWSTIKAWVRGIVGAAGTQIVTALSALAGDARLEASAIRGLPSVGGGATLVGKGDVTASHHDARDTGVDWPASIGADDLFGIVVHNLSDHESSGSTLATGDLINDLDDWEVGEGETPSKTIACDQGDSTDDEYFLGRSSAGDLLISTDVNSNTDLRISLWKLA